MHIGMRWCSSGRHQVSTVECTKDGVVLATCNACRARARAAQAAKRAATVVQADTEPEVFNIDEPEGVAVEEVDEFDDEFGDGSVFASLDLPEDDALPLKERQCISNFLQAEAKLKRDICPCCNHCDWDMDIKNDRCKTCRSDKEPVKKFEAANLVNPSTSSYCPRSIIFL